MGLEGGYRYFMTMIDRKSGHITILLMKKKTSAPVLEYIKAYMNANECLTGQKLKVFRTDGGGEYLSNKTLRYFKSEGIWHETTCLETL
jgi:hypothetical protein